MSALLALEVLGQCGFLAERTAAVRLRIHRDGLPDETAAGVMVGGTSQTTYVATAYHAIGPKSINETIYAVRSVQLQGFGNTPNHSPLLSWTTLIRPSTWALLA